MSSPKARLSRRRFIQVGAAVAAAAGAGVAERAEAQALADPAATPRNGKTPRNIIFMVSDGMSAGVLPIAEELCRIVHQRDTHWNTLLRDPQAVHGVQDMASLSSVVTDSSAASSSWGSGSRIVNGAINMLPDGRPLTPIAEVVRSVGKKVALVTTTTVTHATPAGFAAVQDARNDEQQIAPQYRERVDVILGGGQTHFKPELLQAYANSGYEVLGDRDALLATRSQRLLGLFARGMMPYSIDHRHSNELMKQAPTLAEMTQMALRVLGGQGEGFLMQVEGGRVDHGAHANDSPALAWDQLAFDDAVAVALDYARQRGDTLVVVTSDHGNSNPGIFGTGKGYGASAGLLASLATMKASYSSVLAQTTKAAAGGAVSADHLLPLVKDLLGVELDASHAQAVLNALNKVKGSRPGLNPQLENVTGIFAQVMTNHTAIAWMANSHTADYTILTALGPGAERFAGLHRNTDVFRSITGLWGCPHENPALDPAQWRREAGGVSALPADESLTELALADPHARGRWV